MAAAAGTITVDQEARVARAMREDFTFTASRQGTYLCETAEGKVYRVSEESCTCPDHEHRCSKVEGSRCKHQAALGHKLIADGAALCAKGVRMVQEEKPSAADWLANLDTSAIKKHVEEAKAQDDFDAEFERIFGDRR